MDIEHIYFHFPFCSTVCPYCGFYATRGKKQEITLLVDALLKEIEIQANQFRLNPKTLFVGGGTPSIAKPDEIDRLLSAISKQYVKEITIEANPRTVTLEKAARWKQSGINRVSLGVQSMNEKELLILGRRHKPSDVIESVNKLREVGIENINFDFIFGIPGQSVESLKRTLQLGLDLGSKHVSLYGLTYEEGTPFYEDMKKGKYISDERKEIEMLNFAVQLLADHGFIRYEISNFALPGYQCLHNLAYWKGKDYLGIGPAAFSTVGNRRWCNVADHARYVEELQKKRLPVASMEILDEELKRKEKIFLALRTAEGLPLSQCSEKEKKNIEWLIKEGFGQIEGSRFILNFRGFLVADSISVYFI
ncbi:radical SAM family heme chaperone HemW [Methylacidiphilum caldifontis]|uniref:Heme chaperone HemW n=1 Tax=Methylacidiphilum caldifontis TaxID=2795386 RepID=A0A4Y8PF39_9BACT|nr:radical SAM family heme chaperone HemW [Methylacidiphilum caldifontis]TFE70576.1 coproporphyrinogen III oxidase [Methylacidiphilum caldifontis]